MSIVKGIHHVSMKTCNMDEYEKVIDFYGNILGLRVAGKWDGGILFDAGNGLIEFFTNGIEPLEKGVIRHFSLAVDDVDEIVTKVVEHGYEVFMGPKDIVIPAAKPIKARMAFCHGPLGEEIEFFREYEN